MSKFRPGDIVRVLESPYMTMKKGDFVVVIQAYTESALLLVAPKDARSHQLALGMQQVELAGPYGRYHLIAREICGGEDNGEV